MGVRITLDDRQFPASPAFVDYIAHVVEERPFDGAEWPDQRREDLSRQPQRLIETGERNGRIAMASALGQQLVKRAYDLFVALLAGDVAPIAALQARFHFIAIVGIPRSGGSYLTAELFRALGHDPGHVPQAVAHDGFPDAAPFALRPGSNGWSRTLFTTAEYLAMAEHFFASAKPSGGKVVVPKKLTKAVYAAGHFRQLFGPNAEWIVTVRHPASAGLSACDKSGGPPADGRMAVRSNIEEWVRRDLTDFGADEQALRAGPYFDAYLRYWELYHLRLAAEGLCSGALATIVPYREEAMRAQALRFHRRLESGAEPRDFHRADYRGRASDWFAQAEPVVRRVAGVWNGLGLAFPLGELLGDPA